MKIALKLLSTIFFSTLLFGCAKKIICEPFNEKYAMFVPNMELNDLITFYNNRGDSLVFTYSKGIMVEDQTCDDEGECWTRFVAAYVSKYQNPSITHILEYDGNNSNSIRVRIFLDAINHHEESYSFSYNPKNNPVTVSKTMEDSVLVNGVYYKDVVILNTCNDFDKVYLDKVYVSKDNGFIMARAKDSDVVWTINKPVK